MTQRYKDDLQENRLAIFPHRLEPMAQGIHALVQSTFDENILLDEMIEDGNRTQSPENRLNENFAKKEFQELWRNINHKYVYTVHYDSDELIRKAIAAIDSELYVTELKYILTEGTQQAADQFGDTHTTTRSIGTVKHIFFIAETKGSMGSMELRGVEKAKIECAERLFNDASNGDVRYHQVNNYQNLLDVMKKLE